MSPLHCFIFSTAALAQTQSITIYETMFNAAEGFVANQSVDEQQEWIDYDDFSVIDADGNFINSEIPFNTNNFYDIKIIVNFEQNLWHVKLNGIQILRDLALIPTTAAPSALTVTPY